MKANAITDIAKHRKKKKVKDEKTHAHTNIMIKEINKMNCPLTVYIVSGVDEDDGFKSRGILDVMVCHRFNLPCHSLFYIYLTSVSESQ
jgi:hypothetical protein